MRILRRVLGGLLLAALLSGAVLVHQGYRAYVVHTGSMTPTYRPGDLVIDRPAHGLPRLGQVITFRHSADTSDVVTHRVVGVTPGGLIHTKGDANPAPDAWQLSPAMVRGSVIGGLPRAGYLLVFLKQPAGLGALGASALAMVLLWSLFFPTAETGSRVAPSADHRGGRHSARRATAGAT